MTDDIKGLLRPFALAYMVGRWPDDEMVTGWESRPMPMGGGMEANLYGRDFRRAHDAFLAKDAT